MVPSRGPQQWAVLLAALSAASAATASQRQPYLLRHRSLPAEESEKTNDDDHTIIDLFPFALRLTNVPSTSPFAIVKGDDANLESDEVNAVIDLVEEMGAEILGSHPVFGERYREWSAGEAWTSDFVLAPGGQGGSGGPPLPSGGQPSLPSGAELSRSDGTRKLRGGNLRKLQEPAGEATADQVAAPEATQDESRGEAGPNTETDPASPANSQEAVPAAKQTGTTVLTLPEGSVTFNGAYWEDDPSPLELTSYLVENLDEDELLVQLWPLVCSAKEIADGECNVGLEVASDAVDEAKEAEGGEGGGNGAQVGGPGANPGEGAQGGGEGNGETTDKGTVPGEPSVEGAGEAQDPNQGDGSGDDNNNLKVIIPVVVGAALLAFLVAGLLYRRRKQRQADDATEDGQVLKTVATEDTPPEIPPEELSTAYDTITSPSASPTARTAAASPVAAVAAGAAIATAVAATASQKQASKDIDNILEDFNSDSSYVSDSSAAPSEANTNDASVSLSGLSGILTDASPGPLDDAARNESKRSYSADTAATGDGAKKDDDDDAGAGYLPKSLGGPSAGHQQKQEPFEDNYRSRSAMAIGLKKDMLHVACEAHDAGESTAKTDGAVENAGNGYMHEAGMGYGVTRTLSPKKSTTMMEKQRLAEKLSLRPGKKGKKRREKEAEDELESSKDAILPSNFHRSDSDGGRGEPLGARVDSGSDEEDDESGSFA